MSNDYDPSLKEKLKIQLSDISSIPDPSKSKSLEKQTLYNDLNQAREEHYRDLSALINEELRNKLVLRKIAVWFMIAIISLHFVVSCFLVGFVVYQRSMGNGDILSDSVLVAIVVTLMINFLASLGIIFKYIFSSTAETYSHIERTAGIDD